MANSLAPVLKAKFFDNNGRPAVGYKLFSYAAGSSTKADTYPDPSISTPNPNPIILDFRGEADVWIPPNVSYKFVFSPPTDTDPPTAPIWTVDEVVDSQLITLWGGVDSGIADAYVIDFDAPFVSYDDGTVIYWLPSNTNTGASTLNVNGLGPVPITNQEGIPLGANDILANRIAQVIYLNTGFVLLNPATELGTGQFTGTLSGMTAVTSGQFSYCRNNNICSIWRSGSSGNLVGTSNSSGMVLSGVPTIIRPKFEVRAMFSSAINNGTAVVGTARIMSDGTVTLGRNANPDGGGFDSSGLKGVTGGFMLIYPRI